MSSPNPSSRRDRLTGHAVIAVAVLALLVVTAESARQSLAVPSDGGAAAGATDARAPVPATLQPGPLPTPVPVIDNANAVGSVAPPAGPTAAGPALATVNADGPRTIVGAAPLAVSSHSGVETLAGSSSPSLAGDTSWPSEDAPNTAPAPSPSAVPSEPSTPELTPEATPEPTPKPDKPRPTPPPHPHSPSPSPTESDPAEPEPTP